MHKLLEVNGECTGDGLQVCFSFLNTHLCVTRLDFILGEGLVRITIDRGDARAFTVLDCTDDLSHVWHFTQSQLGVRAGGVPLPLLERQYFAKQRFVLYVDTTRGQRGVESVPVTSTKMEILLEFKVRSSDTHVTKVE